VSCPSPLNPAWILVRAEFAAKNIANFADGRLTPDRLANWFHQILARAAAFRDAFQSFLDDRAVALALHLAHLLDLLLLERAVDFEHLDGYFLGHCVLVDAHDRLDALLQLTLI